MLVLEVATEDEQAKQHSGEQEGERHSATRLWDACSLLIVDGVAWLAVKFHGNASIFALIQLEAFRADEPLVDTDAVALLVFARAVLHTFRAKVQEVVVYASLTGANRVLTLVARLLTSLANSIDRCLILSTAGLLARLVLVEHEAWVALSASEDVTGTFGAARRAELALLCFFVVDLSLRLTDVLASVLERVQLHVRLTACAGLGRSGARLTC